MPCKFKFIIKFLFISDLFSFSIKIKQQEIFIKIFILLKYIDVYEINLVLST